VPLQSYYRADTLSTVLDWVTVDQTEYFTSGPGQYGKNTRGALSNLCGAMQDALTKSLVANPTLDLNDFVHDCDGKNQSGQAYVSAPLQHTHTHTHTPVCTSSRAHIHMH
jgi:hypothetical protein